tara:strand:+ start:698 stop:1294 length:597 start_codon:yes stop_codon:yes gene_type:complete
LSDAKDRLKKLLDGDVEASDIAEDASLVSLADRLYGIKIANVKPVKARDMNNDSQDTPTQEEKGFGQSSSMMVEVIAPAGLPVPDLPHLEMPDLPQQKGKKSVLSILSMTGLLLVILNLFGLFSSLFEGSCEIGDCRSEGQTRVNLMDFYKFGESDGWSYSLLTENMSGVGGVSGGIGIPDIVAIVGLIIGILYFRKK